MNRLKSYLGGFLASLSVGSLGLAAADERADSPASVCQVPAEVPNPFAPKVFSTNVHAAVLALMHSGQKLYLTNLTNASGLVAHTLFEVQINPEMRVKVNSGAAAAELVADENKFFLVRIQNDSGTTAPLELHVTRGADWLDAEVIDAPNLPVALSGAPVEYRLVKLRSHAVGAREARISLHVGQGTQDLGFRNEVDLLFNCQTNLTFTLPPSTISIR